jgi:hypothetical protein
VGTCYLLVPGVYFQKKLYADLVCVGILPRDDDYDMMIIMIIIIVEKIIIMSFITTLVSSSALRS